MFKKSLLGLCGLATGLTVGTANLYADQLVYGSWLPPSHVVVAKGLEPFFERVKEDSNGDLTWQLLSGGAMGGPKEAMQVVEDGVVDSSLLVDVYFKKELPTAVTLSDLFMLVDDQLVWGAALAETQLIDCEACQKEFADHGLKPLAFYTGGDYHLMCTHEVHDLDALNGLKVRTSSRNGALAEHWGAVPVSTTITEMYEAMQRGQADCAIGAYAFLTSYGLKDLVSSVVETPIGGIFSALVLYMTEDRWGDLSDEQQKVIIKNLPQLVADINFSYLEEGQAAAEEAKKAGVNFYEMGPKMKASFDEFLAGEVSVSVEKAKAAGVENPEDVIAILQKNVEKWHGIMDKIGYDREKYAEALWTEIYSKL